MLSYQLQIMGCDMIQREQVEAPVPEISGRLKQAFDSNCDMCTRKTCCVYDFR
jgi:hypothetical protein